jgi:hypothetical protein
MNWVAQWIVVAIVVVAALVVARKTRAWDFLRAAEPGKEKKTASPEKRKETYAALLAKGSQLSDFDTSSFLLGIAVDLYDRKQAAVTALDDKAQKLVAFIGGGATLFALLAGISNGVRAELTPLLVLAASCFFVSLILCLLALMPIERDVLAITQYNSIPVLADAGFRGKIAWHLIDAWQEITLGLTPILRKKGRYIFGSSVLITAGATLLLMNFLLNLATKPSPAPAGVHCSASTMSRKWQRITLTCEDHKT